MSNFLFPPSTSSKKDIVNLDFVKSIVKNSERFTIVFCHGIDDYSIWKFSSKEDLHNAYENLADAIKHTKK